MQQSCERRDQGGGKWGSGREVPQGRGSSTFFFCSWKLQFSLLYRAEEGESERERESEADTLGKFTLELAGFSAAGGGRAGSEP